MKWFNQFRQLRQLILNNWKLKLLSLCIAILLWYVAIL